MGADARSARDEAGSQVRLVKEPRSPSRELGGDPDRLVVSIFRVGGSLPADFEAHEDELLTVKVEDSSGNVLALRQGRASVELRPVHPAEGPAFSKRIQSVRFYRGAEG